MAGSPTLRRRRLGAELLRLRDAAAMTLDEAARAAGISISHLSRIENAAVGVRTPTVKALLQAYGADPELSASLLQIAAESKHRGWWHSYTDVISERYAMLIGFEADATTVQGYEASVVPGLLQTRDYAEAVIRDSVPRLDDEAVARRVEVRLARQIILGRDEPAQFWFILDEAAIRRQVGGPAVMRRQLDHLLDLTRLPHVDLQVLPFTAGAHPGIMGSISVLLFTEPGDPPVVYVETQAGNIYPEKEAETRRLIAGFDRLRAISLSPYDSADLIRQAMKELE